MNVKNLIDILNTLDPKSELVMQINANNTGYTPIFNIDANVVLHNNIAYSTQWSAEEAGFSETEWQLICSQDKIPIIYSIN